MKTMSVDAFLSWAFLHELAKGGGEEGTGGRGSAWAALNGLAELGTMVDRTRGASDFGGFIDDGPPHPDAVIAGRCVADLGEVVIDLAPEWMPTGSITLTGCGPDARGLVDAAVTEARARLAGARAARSLVALVITCATLRRPPHWDACEAALVPERDIDGRDMWFVHREGERGALREVFAPRDPKTHRRPADAFRKFRIEPPLLPALMDRAEWMQWRAAMDLVFADLAEERFGVLTAHRVTPCTEPLEPWAARPLALVADREAFGL